MELGKSHLQIIDNLQLALRKCEIPGAKGEEMLALAQGYHFLTYMKQYIETQAANQAKQQVAQQSISTAKPIEEQSLFESTASKSKSSKKQ